MTQASIVIPAHDEATVIGRCLDALAAEADRIPGGIDLEVVVVANGCSDDTAAVASSRADRLPGLQVVDIGAVGKIGALNAGDEQAKSWPRIYLDADIELVDGALGGLVDLLAAPEPLVASPRIRFDLDGSSRLVRMFYDIYVRLPYISDGLVGLGVYGLSEAGRGRFREFPPVTADDLFVQRLFGPDERRTAAGVFVVRAPKRVSNLIAVRTRTAVGNAELAIHTDLPDEIDASQSTRATVKALIALVRRQPDLLAAAMTYVAVTVISRLRSRRPVPQHWPRDDSTRIASVAAPERATAVVVDGVPFDPVTEPEAVAHVMDELDRGRGGLVLTPNTDIMRQLRSGPNGELARVADLVVADGMPVVWASQVQGTPLPARVAGADLVWSLSAAAAERDRSVFLFGAGPGVAARAADQLKAVSPALRVAGHLSPPLGFETDPDSLAAVLETVRAASPDLVFVALGFPKQERLALQLRPVLPATWFLGCGGALDMAAGDVDRADGRLQSMGLEWLHRLAREPRRLAHRYLVDDIPYALGLLGRAGLRRFRR